MARSIMPQRHAVLIFHQTLPKSKFLILLPTRLLYVGFALQHGQAFGRKAVLITAAFKLWPQQLKLIWRDIFHDGDMGHNVFLNNAHAALQAFKPTGGRLVHYNAGIYGKTGLAVCKVFKIADLYLVG